MKRIRSGRVGIAFAILVAGCISAPPPPPEALDGASPGPAVTGSPVDVNEHAAFAVWPEDDPGEAAEAVPRLEAGEDRWRSEPLKTALTFARERLHWDDAEVLEAADRRDGPVEVRIGRSGAEVPPTPLTVTVAQLVADRWWSVTSVVGLMNPLLSVGLFPQEYESWVVFDHRGADSVSVEVGYGGEIVDSGAILNVRLFPLDDNLPCRCAQERPGHLLLRWIRGTEVIDAVAFAVPPGTFRWGLTPAQLRRCGFPFRPRSGTRAGRVTNDTLECGYRLLRTTATPTP